MAKHLVYIGQLRNKHNVLMENQENRYNSARPCHRYDNIKMELRGGIQITRTGTTPLWCMVTQLKGSAESWCRA
jgi:hypothetical protein